jgi:effector-binding domain-containing protein
MKKVLTGVLLVLLLVLGWFLFIKKYDYRFHFDAKYGPGVVYQELRSLEQFSVFQNSPEIINLDTELYSELDQKVNFKNNQLELHWELEPKNDSITDILLYVSSPHKVKNRLSILNPFSKSDYVDSLTNIFVDFGKQLRLKQNSYGVKVIDSIVYSPSLECICRSASNIKVSQKASQMVQDIVPLESFLLDHDLKLNGYPFVKVTRWDREEDLIDYDFCFPVNLAQDIKPDHRVDFRQVSSSTSLKAIYNGNYRSSDFAWYDLMYKAEQEGYKTSGLPLEIFFNNPKSEINAPGWKAEVYLPVVVTQ